MLKKRSVAKKAVSNTSEYQDVLDRIKPVGSLGLVLAALFYGRAGSGKTTLASSFPKPLLHLDIREKGTDSISDVQEVQTLSVENWDDFESVYWLLQSGTSGYKTVVIDAVSQLQDFAVEKAMADDKKQDGIVTKRQWGTASGKLKTWLVNYRDLVDLGINVVFLAHDRVSEGEEGEDGELTPSVGPRLMPSVAGILTAAVKLVGNTFVKEEHEKLDSGKRKRKVQYCLRLGPHAYYETKVRQPKGSFVPDMIDDPHYDDLISIMKGTYKPATPKEVPTSRKLIKKGA